MRTWGPSLFAGKETSRLSASSTKRCSPSWRNNPSPPSRTFSSIRTSRRSSWEHPVHRRIAQAAGHAPLTTHTPVYFKIVKSLAEQLAVSQEEIDNLYYASVLRDAGAIDVPYNILAKTSQLTPEEFKVIREHPAQSVELIRPVDFLRPVLPIILYRREHYDGTGYPSGLKREQIPIGARIMAVVDAFEAMTRERPYKMRLSVEEAIRELRMNSGTQFDPRVIDAFIVCTGQKKFKIT